MIHTLEHAKQTILSPFSVMIRNYRPFVLIATLLITTPTGSHATADSSPNHQPTLQNVLPAENTAGEQAPRDDPRTILFAYAATAMWVTLVCAGTLVVLITASKIPTSQAARNSGEL